jgi:hypothetical protein
MTGPILAQLESLLREAAQRRAQTTLAGEQAVDPRTSTNGRAPDMPGPTIVQRRGRWRPRTRGGLLALAAVLATGTAVAATQPWSPLIGDNTRGHPTITSQPPPPKQLAQLAVLRRPQTDLDRSAGVRTDLRLIGSQAHGVRTAYIRYLALGPDGAPIILVPARRFGDDAAGPPYYNVTDSLCVLFPFTGGPRGPRGADFPCWTVEEVRAGTAFGMVQSSSRRYVFGVILDGVASVAVHLSDGTVLRTRVRNNFFEVAVPKPRAGGPALAPAAWRFPRRVQWFAADGTAVPPPRAATQ